MTVCAVVRRVARDMFFFLYFFLVRCVFIPYNLEEGLVVALDHTLDWG